MQNLPWDVVVNEHELFMKFATSEDRNNSIKRRSRII
jgi:hypothetical protein